jgi:hypothetical protein
MLKVIISLGVLLSCTQVFAQKSNWKTTLADLMVVQDLSDPDEILTHFPCTYNLGNISCKVALDEDCRKSLKLTANTVQCEGKTLGTFDKTHFVRDEYELHIVGYKTQLDASVVEIVDTTLPDGRIRQVLRLK